MRVVSFLAVVAAAAFFAAPSFASGWLPHPTDATWTYQWTDSVYQTTPVTEHVSVVRNTGSSYVLGWTVDGGSQNTNLCQDASGAPLGQNENGWVELQDTNLGIVNGPNGWCGAAPPPDLPILCATAARCGNSLGSSLYNVIWGSRTPVLFEPLLGDTSWTATGAAANDVASSSDYLGTESITVPAFDKPVIAAKVRSQITQAGAIGDPYGSGVRTIWWVYGVGPVKIVFQHSGGSGAPVTTVELQATNQTPQAPPADAAYLPFNAGLKGTYRWTNKRYFKKPEVESWTVDQTNQIGTSVVKVQSVSGPMKVAGVYQFTARLDGVTSVSSSTKAASLAKLPPLGPIALPAKERRHFFTPFDLMTFGFNPVLPAYPVPGTTWASEPNSRDFSVYGVNGTSRVVGVQKVTVPAGTFDALVVASNLTQPGFKFGSGIRTMWFVDGKGLVKLQFRHADGSVSVVVLLK